MEGDGLPGRAKWIEGLTRVRVSIDHWGEGYTTDWGRSASVHAVARTLTCAVVSATPLVSCARNSLKI